MTREPGDDDDIGRELDALLRRQEEAAADTPAHELFRRLHDIRARGSRPTLQEHVAVYKALRDQGAISPDAGFYAVASMLIMIGDQRGERDPRMQAAAKRGADNEETERVAHEIIAEVFREHGEPEYAEEILADHHAFYDRVEAAGRRAGL